MSNPPQGQHKEQQEEHKTQHKTQHKHEHQDHSEIFHSHAPVGKMKLAFMLTLSVFVVELIGGLISHSLALLSDAGHVLTDIAAIGLTWFALKQSLKPSTDTMTFGYYRSGILVAFLNAVTLIVIAVFIMWEAFGRFGHPQPVGGIWMLISPTFGLAMNLFLGLWMNKENNINVRSATLHIFGDAAASGGVIVGAVVISQTGWYVVDPILSVLIALMISYGAWNIVVETVYVLMEATPKGIDVQHITRIIRSVKGVSDVHDLHVWSITSGQNSLSCHVVIDGQMSIEESQSILREIEHKLIHAGIGHATIQTEDDGHPHANTVLCAHPQQDHHH